MRRNFGNVHALILILNEYNACMTTDRVLLMFVL